MGRWIAHTQPRYVHNQSTLTQVLSQGPGTLATGRVQGEDCLYLTVNALERGTREYQKLLAVVSLHRGAYVSGMSDLDCYEPSVPPSKVAVAVKFHIDSCFWAICPFQVSRQKIWPRPGYSV